MLFVSIIIILSSGELLQDEVRKEIQILVIMIVIVLF